ncbi:MAG: SDR family NAD(P)-dependent oxidoreductase [Caldisphaera sp.]|jgi:NAD(P)-dependent dehydrogenase (short-subunit alcohol dehydrogenase family)
MKLEFNDKIIIITGGAGTIGSVTAKKFLECGAKVVHLVDKNEEELRLVFNNLNSLFPNKVKIDLLDLRNIKDIIKVISKIIEDEKQIDILFNHAGINLRKPAIQITENDWDMIIDINLKGLFFVAKIVGEHMIKKKKGVIINTGSVSSLRGHPNLSVYAASKGGIKQITKVLANEWAQYNVRVNAIAPGYVRTNLTAKYLSNKSTYESIVSKIPMGRLGEPEEIANAVLFLASEMASYITGELLVIDGGRTID